MQELLADPHRMWILKTGMVAKDGAAVHPVQPVLDTRAVVEHDLVFACFDFRHVHADRSGPDAVVPAAPGQVRGVGAGHQRLGRNASGVDTGAAEQFAFDYRDALPGSGQPTRERGPGLTGTHDDRIEMRCHQL